MTSIEQFGWNLRKHIGDGDAGTIRADLAELLGAELDTVRVWVNKSGYLLRIEVANAAVPET